VYAWGLDWIGTTGRRNEDRNISEIIAQHIRGTKNLSRISESESFDTLRYLYIDKRSTSVLNFAILKIISRQIDGADTHACTLMNVRPTINSRNAARERK